MKLSTVLIAGAALAGAAIAAVPAKADTIATVFELYPYDQTDGAYSYVTNSTMVTFDDIIVNGTDFGALLAGVSTNWVYLGDNEGCCQANTDVTITIGSQIFSGSFADVLGDPDYNVDPVAIGTIEGTIPEPASLALMGVGLFGAGWMRRRVAAVQK